MEFSISQSPMMRLFALFTKPKSHFGEQNNIEISFFSPLANQAPNENADMIFLPGGYPELFAKQISHANNFIAGLKQAEQAGKWIYGECGGYMVLGQGLEDGQGKMLSDGRFARAQHQYESQKTPFGTPQSNLKHVPTPFQGKCFRGHEFHYSELCHARDTNHADDSTLSQTQPFSQPLFS